jgi:hypothetical protein
MFPTFDVDRERIDDVFGQPPRASHEKFSIEEDSTKTIVLFSNRIE